MATRILLEKAVFVSGRDEVSADSFARVLNGSNSPVVKPDSVRLVRDPVLSNGLLTDVTGTCWKQGKGTAQRLTWSAPVMRKPQSMQCCDQYQAQFQNRCRCAPRNPLYIVGMLFKDAAQLHSYLA